MMSTKTHKEKRPYLFIYSLLLPAAWFGIGTIMNTIFPGKRLGIVGLIAIVFVVVWLISEHFAKNFRRHFSGSERARLIVYCSFWAISAELLALYAYVSDLRDSGNSVLEIKGMILVVAVTAVVDVLIIWAAVTRVAKRFIDASLQKNRQSVT